MVATTRRKRKQAPLQVVDGFAGGGGASLGILRALGQSPNVAINHDAAALHVHALNHPETLHLREDVWEADLPQRTSWRKVDLLWLSPDCRHHARARGSAPVSDSVRSLAWIACKWGEELQPKVIILENVREFLDWGPIVTRWRCPECRWIGIKSQTKLKRKQHCCPRCKSQAKATSPREMVADPAKKGSTFRRWVAKLRSLKYIVEWRILDAADFGAPTHRKRLFLVARCDDQPISWPKPTHGPKSTAKKPYRVAAECIDWSIPSLSIFATKEEARTWAKENNMKGVPQRPLKENTLRRIAMGLWRYVLNAQDPYLVSPYMIQANHGGDHFRGQSLDKPMSVVTGSRGQGLATPFLARLGQTGSNGLGCQPIHGPLSTIVGQAEHLLISPTLVQTGYSEREGQAPRALDPQKPLGTVVSSGIHHALAAAHLTKFYGGVVGHGLERPLGTVTQVDHHGVVAASLTRFYGNSIGADLNKPLPTVSREIHDGIISTNLLKFRGQSQGGSVNDPLPTITAGAGAQRPAGAAHAMGLASTCLIRMNHGDKQWDGVNEPLRTITSQGNKFALVYAFLVKYFGTAIGAPVDEPIHTVTSKQRFGLVTIVTEQGHLEDAISLDLGPLGIWVIADILMRMLHPQELALAQGFPADYQFVGSNSQKVKLIGNSVSPQPAEAIVRANFPSRSVCL